MKKSITQLRPFFKKTIPTFVFGQRAQGEKLKEPSFRSSIPASRPTEFEWYKEFRVSSLHGIDQKVFIG